MKRELSALEHDWLAEVDRIDRKIIGLSNKTLTMRNTFLIGRDWDITSEKIGPTLTYYYKKDEKMFIDVHEAMDYELYGEVYEREE